MDVLKIVIPTALTSIIGFLITPFFTHFFYKYKMWKRSARIHSNTSEEFAKIHNSHHEVSTPRIGGMIIWVAVFLTVCLIYLAAKIYPHDFILELNFFSRSQTLVPLGAFFLAALVGLADDFLQIIGQGEYAKDPLIYRRIKIVFVTLIALSISLWLHFKLDFTSIHLPFDGEWQLGLWFIPVFIIVMLATFSTTIIDGIDGLSGGVLAIIFLAYAVISFVGGFYDISALSGAVGGGVLAFLWYNIPPARFYMGETGMLALTVLLSVMAFLTNTVLLLPLIAFPLVVTSLSAIIQMTGYKYFNKKRVFLVAPLHHHFQAKGWPREKVVMRYWIVSFLCALLGVILSLVS